MICNIFNPQAQSKGVTVSWKFICETEGKTPQTPLHTRNHHPLLLHDDSRLDSFELEDIQES